MFLDAMGIAFVIIVVISIIILISFCSAINNMNGSPPPTVSPPSPKSQPKPAVPASEPSKRFQPTYVKCKETPMNFIVIDVQTTGLDCTADSILQITAVKYVNLFKKDVFQSYVKYTKSIPPEAQAINRISESMVQDAPPVRKVLNELLNYIGDDVLIAYNADFTIGFLQYNYNRKLQKQLYNPIINGMDLASEYFWNLPDLKLKTLSDHFGISSGATKSDTNCSIIAALYQYCYEHEQYRYLYSIPFSSTPEKLTNKEIEYVDAVVQLCQDRGINTSDLSMRCVKPYIEIQRGGRYLIRFKLNGKLQYALIAVPYKKIQQELKTEVTCTAGNSSELGMTRIFLEAPSQLKEFKKYIFIAKNHVWTT